MGNQTAGALNSVCLPLVLRGAVVNHVERVAPDEACGLVARGVDGLFVHVYQLTNIDPRPNRFLIDPVEHFASITHADTAGWTVAGVYHSHPIGPGEPSAIDLAAPIDPTWISFVVSRSNDRWGVRAFNIRGGTAVELQLVEESSVDSLR